MEQTVGSSDYDALTGEYFWGFSNIKVYSEYYKVLNLDCRYGYDINDPNGGTVDIFDSKTCIELLEK